ncbi:MAG: hypothetical protein MUE36_08210 [Acidimicrobiales bacterium]|nr:hypothetical protein [Acidimicrobiales bacterium]
MRHTPSTLRRVRLTAGAVVVVVASFGALAACSSDDDSTTATTVDAAQNYCDAWSSLISAFEAYDEIDIVNGGLDSVRSYFDELETAARQLAEAADAQLEPAVDAFTTSLDDLGTALTSSSLPVDRRDQVRAATEAVDSAWNDLVEAAKAGCPSVTATTVDADAA